jgi:cation diffusion facilitator family transporter
MDSFQGIRRVLWIALGLNLIPAVFQLITGAMTSSLSLLADGFDSLFNAGANAIGLVGIYVAAKPVDTNHPYGHRKAETITALIIAYVLFLTTFEFVQMAVSRLINPSLVEVDVNVLSYTSLAVGIAVQLYIGHFQLKEGRRLHSDVLVAEAKHIRADVYVSLSVIAGLTFVLFGIPIGDPIAALIVAVVIADIGVGIIRSSTPTLMDQVAVPADWVENIARSVPGIISVQKVRSRGHEQEIYADLHVRVDPKMDTEQAHGIAHEVQRKLREARPDIKDVTIHVEPAEDKLPINPDQGELARQLRFLASRLGLTVHDIWAHHILGKYYIESHLEVDGSISLLEAHQLASNLEEQAKAEIPNLVELTTHIEPRGRMIGEDAPTEDEAAIAQKVQDVIDLMLGGIKVHEVHVRQGDKGWMVTLHCNLPGEITLAEAHSVTENIESQLRRKIPRLERVIVHTEPTDIKCDLPETLH